MPSIDVIYVRNLKPGDLYVGKISGNATPLVQPFAWAHQVKEATLYIPTIRA